MIVEIWDVGGFKCWLKWWMCGLDWWFWGVWDPNNQMWKELVEWLTRVMTGTWSWLASWFRRNLWKISEAMSVSSIRFHLHLVQGIQEVHAHFSWSSLKCLPAKGIYRDHRALERWVCLSNGGIPNKNSHWYKEKGMIFYRVEVPYFETDWYMYTLPIIHRCFACVCCVAFYKTTRS